MFEAAIESAKEVGGLVKPCYCENVKNITISLPDDVYRRARIRAAERDTSVTAMVREFLLRLDSADADFERGKALQEEVRARIEHFRASGRLSRDEIHERDALR